VELQLNKTTVFIGENNSGKTACLEAIKNILGRISADASFEEYDYYAEGNESAPKFSDGISIKFIFSETHSDEWHEEVKSKFGAVIQPFHDDVLDVDLCQIILCVTSKYHIATGRFEVAYNFQNHQGENLAPETQYLIVDFLKCNPVFYLQALIDSADVFSGKSFMWGKFLEQIPIKPEKLEEIKKNIFAISKDDADKDESLNALVSSMHDIEKVLDFHVEDRASVNALPIKSLDLLPICPLQIPPAASISNRLRCEFPAFVIPSLPPLSALECSPGANPR
jgi:putative ATP-dependent endonuclease of OLD family